MLGPLRVYRGPWITGSGQRFADNCHRPRLTGRGLTFTGWGSGFGNREPGITATGWGQWPPLRGP